MVLKKQDIKLVEQCINLKWEPLANGCYDRRKYDSLCPLCNEYWDNYCECCPIYKVTGKHRCNGTPLQKIYDLEESIGGGGVDDEDYLMASDFPEFNDAVEEMVEFLISMLPEDHEWRKV